MIKAMGCRNVQTTTAVTMKTDSFERGEVALGQIGNATMLSKGNGLIIICRNNLTLFVYYKMCVVNTFFLITEKGKTFFIIKESKKNIKYAEIQYNIENYTYTAKELFSIEENQPICVEKHLEKDPSICILALVLDTEKSVYVGHFHAKVGNEELPSIVLTFERPNTSLGLSIGLALISLILISLLGIFTFLLVYYSKHQKLPPQLEQAVQRFSGKISGSSIVVIVDTLLYFIYSLSRHFER